MAVPSRATLPVRDALLENPIAYIDFLYDRLAQEVNRPGWLLSDTVAVAAGATVVVVPIQADRLPYQLYFRLSWDAGTVTVEKAVDTFTLTVSTPAPAGATLDYTIVNLEQGG